jgi:hypothetical protein
VFRFGAHLRGLLWDKRGHLITDNVSQASLDARNAFQLSSSEWLETFKGEAVDFLLEQHSAETTRALRQMKDSDFMRALLNTDGPARRTRLQTRKRLVLGESDDEAEVSPAGPRGHDGAGSSGAGPSGS